MDNAHKSKRKFPSMTTGQLKASIARAEAAKETIDLMKVEVIDRQLGLSVTLKTPQVAW